MKLRESGMPDEAYWETLFDVPLILDRLGINHQLRDVVELGCGYGTFSLPVAQRISGVLTTFDIDPTMVERTRQRAAQAEVGNVFPIVGDAFADGFGEPGSKDACLLFNILHCEQPVRLLTEATRVVRPSGYVYVIHWRYDPATPRGPAMDSPELLFCDNDTNVRRLYGDRDARDYFKDAFHDYLVAGIESAVNPRSTGTKVAAHYPLAVPAGKSVQVRLRLTKGTGADSFVDFDEVIALRRREADEFYASLQVGIDDPDARNVQRQALAGMIWSKQYYYYDVPEWIRGDPAQPAPPPGRRHGRNHEWSHLNNAEIIYYDVLNLPNGHSIPLKVRSLVGLIPLFAVETLEPDLLARLPDFACRLEWFLNYRPDLARLVSRWQEPGLGQRHLFSLLRGSRMKSLLRRMLDEPEFLSEFGVRALSRQHRDQPFRFPVDGDTLEVRYEPGESTSTLFGGNSNWRGPIWMPVNYLIIESLQEFHHYYGDDFKVECPTGSGQFMTICEVAHELTRRLTRLFLKGADGQRPALKAHAKTATDPHFHDYLWFHEYFHGDNGQGVGASHQTGWTGLVAKLIQPRVE